MATINQITVNSTTYDLAVSAANVSGTVANATTATKLGTANKGSATQPIYLSAGAPTACTYSLAKSVPADAKFTDTTYSNFVKSGSGAKAGLVPAPSTTAGTTKYLREDGTWVKPPNTTYSNMGAATSSAAGSAGLVPAPAAGAQAKFLRGDGTWQTPSTSYTLPTASSSTLGGVKVGTGLGISSGTLSVSYGTTATTACKGNDSRLSDSRTPKAHASSATTYGAGTASNYGHVKLSDSYTTSGGAAAAGVAASSYALVTAYNTLNSKLNNIAYYDNGTVSDTLIQTVNQGIYRFDAGAAYSPRADQMGTIITTVLSSDASGVKVSSRLCITSGGETFTSTYIAGIAYGSWSPVGAGLELTPITPAVAWNVQITSNVGYKYGKLCHVYVTFRTSSDIPANTSLFSIPRPYNTHEAIPPYIRRLHKDEVKSCIFNSTYNLIINNTVLPGGHDYIFEWMYFTE